MPKRPRRGGRPPAVLDRAVLRRRIWCCDPHASSSSSAKSIAADLQDRFPDYRRLRRQPLALLVEQSLSSLPPIPTPTPTHTDDSDSTSASGSDSDTPSNSDPSERRLARHESNHLRRIRKLQDPSPTSSSASSDNDGDSSTSTSDAAEVDNDDDAATKIDPEHDSYADQSKAMEIEAAVEEPIKGAGEVRVTRDETSEEGPRFRDLGGMEAVIEELMMEVVVPLCHPQLPQWLGVRPMSGILLHGPPGCGKTKLAHAIANETGVSFYKISATEVVSGVSGASEEYIRDLFKKAYRTAPSIVFIDEIDAIASKRENLQREMERRIVTQLMTCMDELHQTLKAVVANAESEAPDRKPGYVLVVGATNRPDAVDQALRRPGRFDREIALGIPDENARVQILIVLTRNLRLEGNFDLLMIARSTPGFVGADLAALANKAGNLAMKRIIDRRKSESSSEHKDKNTDWWRHPWTPEEMETLNITMADFEEAVKIVQPSSRREGFSSIPNVKWEDVGGLNSLRKEFDRYIIQRIKNRDDYAEFGVNLEAGILLHGPPGCGKTLIAKAVANEAGANFIHIKGPELLNKYVGESELAVRTIFRRARTCAPCILFFDEVDALTTTRGKDGGWVVERLLNQLLIELDGADLRQDVFVIGATNRLEVMDPAVLRPGRFGKILYVPLPNADERGLILKALARKKPVAADVDLDAIGRREACNNLTGADLAALMNEAAMAAMEEKQMSMVHGSSTTNLSGIMTSHFEKALEKITPSVSEKQRGYYEALSRNPKSGVR